METPTGQRLLADMIREKPDAFDFDDITDVVPGRSSAGTSATLTQILGGFTYFGKDDVAGTLFYGRKPKVKALERMIDLLNAPIDEGDGVMKAVIGRSCRVAAMLLYVQQGDGWRPATEEEIGEAFDLDQLNEIRNLFSGLTFGEKTEGNA